MKHLFLLLLLAMGVPGRVDAQEIVTLDQRFQLHYSRWQSGQGAAAASTQSTYAFNLGMPVLTYRLGALALTGSVDYERQSSGGVSSGSLGLNRYGLKSTLFPYRPFHLTFDYSHSQSPGIAGLGSVSGDTYGLGLNYRGRSVQDLNISFRQGSNTQAASREGWSLWRMVARQEVRGTRLSFDATHQDFGSSEGMRWRSSTLFAATDTAFSRAWALRSNLQADESGGSRTLNTALSLTGTPGRWNWISSLSLNENQGSSTRSRATLLSQSVALNGTRFSAFSSAALSSLQIQGGQGDANRGTLLLGGAYALGRGWRASLDVSESFGTVTQAATPPQGQPGGDPSQQNLKTIHAGLSQGGDVPAIIGRTLFYLSEQRFQRSVAEDYAPGYVPSELAAEMARRRFRQSGNFVFAGDFFHTQTQGGGSKLDWGRVTGQLRMNAGWTLQIIGDWRKDDGLAVPGARVESKNVSLNGAYHFGVSSIISNVGYSNSQQSYLPGYQAFAPAATLDVARASQASRFLSLGFNSRFWLLPYTLQWTKFEDGWQAPTNAFVGFFTLNFRQVSLRMSYQEIRRGDGLRDNRISVDLLRWFDTIAFRGLRP